MYSQCRHLMNKLNQRWLKCSDILLCRSDPGPLPLCSSVLFQNALIILTSKIRSRYQPLHIDDSWRFTAMLPIHACRSGCTCVFVQTSLEWASIHLIFIKKHEVMWPMWPHESCSLMLDRKHSVWPNHITLPIYQYIKNMIKISVNSVFTHPYYESQLN